MAVRTASGGKAEWASAGGATFAEIPHVRTWTLRHNPEAKIYASSSTGGARQRLPGPEDFNGTVSVYIDDADRFDGDFKAGDTAVFKLYEDDTQFFEAPVYIESIDYETNIEDGEIVGAVINYTSDGTLVYPA